MIRLYETAAGYALYWWTVSPEKLSEHLVSLLEDPNTIVYVSVATLWELQIKVQIGKMELLRPLDESVTILRTENDIEVLPIVVEHVLDLDNLPLHHRDPFDRILIAQARVEDATVVSKDNVFGQYDVPLLW